MNTSRLHGCYTASQMQGVLKSLREEATHTYGRDTAEHAAAIVLMEHDARGMVDAQIKHLNAELTRVQRQLVEWLALLPPVKVGIGG